MIRRDMDSRSFVRGFLAMAIALVGGLAALPRLTAQSAATINPALYSALKWRLVGPFRAGRVNTISGVIGQPNTFYFGSVGGGVWKSTNIGRTWTPIFDGNNVASIGAIGVAPSNPDVLYVGTGEADMRDSIAFGDGMYKSTDAGKTWTHIGLESTRQIGRVIVHPRDPAIVFVAALGHVYGPHPDRGVYRSRDGGTTWQKVLFKGDGIGAIDLAFDPANPQTVFAAMWAVRRPPWFIYAPANGPGGGLFKSVDGGTTWAPVTNGLPSDGLGRMGIAVAPSNPKRIYVIADAKDGGLFRSDDGGATFTKVSGDPRLWGRGWYFTKIAVDPKNPEIVYLPNTGVYKSTDGGRTWGAPIKASPGGDDYHQLWISPEDPSRLALAGDQGAIVSVDAGQTWSSWYNQPTAQLYHVAADYRFPYWLTAAQHTGETKNITPEVPEPGVTYRRAWTQPLVFSQADRRALYFGNQFVYKTTDGGESWAKISDDLTREDPGVPPNLDAAAAADAPAGKRRGVVYTLAPSPVRAAIVWAGTDDGLIHLTQDEGLTWQNVTPPEITPWTKVVMIDASHFDAHTAYAAAERHQLEDYEPHIYRTRDAGKSWQAITKGLPAGIYVQTVKEDPQRRGLLFCGTERGVFVSFDEGDNWQSLQLNLPPSSMRDLQIKDDDLVVATHGRGFWVLDDITALHYLKTAASAPVTLEVLDASGAVVRRFASDDRPAPRDPSTLAVQIVWAPQAEPLPATAGMHRWVWDLRGSPPPAQTGRGGGRGRGAPIAPPGRYSVRLTVDGKTFTHPLIVRQDPRGTL